MTVKDCVKTMLSKRGWSQRKLAEELGYSGQGSIGKTLLRNDGMQCRNPVHTKELRKHSSKGTGA